MYCNELDFMNNKRTVELKEQRIVSLDRPLNILIKEYINIPTHEKDSNINMLGDYIFNRIIDTKYKIDADAIKAISLYLFKNKIDNIDRYVLEFKEKNALLSIQREYGQYSLRRINGKNKHTITINVKNLSKCKGNLLYETIDTFFHELYHSINMKNQIMGHFVDVEHLQMALDTVIHKNYYRKNYSVLIEEAKAREYGIRETNNILILYNEFDENYLYKKQRELDYLESLIKINRVFPNNRNMLEFSYNKSKNIIKKEPDYITAYPILEVLYDKDGFPKKVSDILKKTNMYSLRGSQKDMYCEIIYLMLKKDPTLIYRMTQYHNLFKYALSHMEEKLNFNSGVIKMFTKEENPFKTFKYLKIQGNLQQEIVTVKVLNKITK